MKHIMEINGKIFEITGELAQRLGIDTNTVPKWVQRGLLPKPLKIGRHNYYQRDRVDELIGKGE